MAKEKAALKSPTGRVDAETRVHDDHHLSLRLWLRLLTCTNQVESHVRQNLQANFDTTLPRFDLMAQLERAPQGLKMSELSQRMMVTGRQRHRHHRRAREGRPGGARSRQPPTGASSASSSPPRASASSAAWPPSTSSGSSICSAS